MRKRADVYRQNDWAAPTAVLSLPNRQEPPLPFSISWFSILEPAQVAQQFGPKAWIGAVATPATFPAFTDMRSLGIHSACHPPPENFVWSYEMKRSNSAATAKAFFAAMTFLSLSVSAGRADDFYRGKTMSVIVPIGPGGAYDAVGRLVARHLGKHIPGNPNIISRLMPGAAGVNALNHLYNVAPHDGTVIALATSSFANEQLIGNSQIRYDARRFGIVGRILETTSVLFFWHASPIKSLDDVLNKPSNIAIATANELPTVRLRAMNRFLGAQMRFITGYPSSRDYVLAAERGEADGGGGTYVGLLQLFGDYVRERKLNIVLQFARQRDMGLPGTPAILELTEDPEVRSIFQFLVSNDEIGRTLITTPNVPADRLALLRNAFDKMTEDPGFRADAKKQNLPLTISSGIATQKVVHEVFGVSAGALDKIRELNKP
jgi:tripartite-type tricarboxylate transporter receptor subunit TctC